MIKSLSAVVMDVFAKVSKSLGMDKVESRDFEYIQKVLKEKYDDNDEIIPLSENMIKGSLKRLLSILNAK